MANDRQLRIVATAQDRVSGVFAQISKAADGLQKGISSFGENLQKNTLISQAFGTALGFEVAGALSQVRAQIMATEDRVLSYEKGLASTNTILRVSQEELGNLEKSINGISSSLPVAKQELIDASFYIASAGVSAENMAAALELSAKVAVGAQTTTVEAFNGIIAVVKSYGLNLTEATKIADLFFKTNELGYTTVGEVADSIQRVASVAAVAGVSVEELFTVYSTLTGVTGNANEVTTQLRATIQAIAAPTESARNKMEELGIAYGRTTIEQKGFEQTIKDVFDAVDGNLVQLRELIPSEEALALVTNIATSQNAKFEESLRQAEDATGSLEEAVVKMTQTSEAKFLIMQEKSKMMSEFVGKFIVGLKSNMIDFAYVMKGVAQVFTGASILVSESFQAGFSFAVKVLEVFVRNFGEAGRQALEIAKNIAKNIKAAFTGGEFVPITDGAKRFQHAMESISSMAMPEMRRGLDMINEGFQNVSTQAISGAATQNVFQDQLFGTQGALEGLDGGMVNATDSAGALAEETDKAAEYTKKLEDAYTSARDVIGKALEEVAQDTVKALEGLDSKLKDVLSSMASESQKFLSQEAGSRQDLAQAIIEQEEKIRSLADEMSKLDPAKQGDKIAELQAELDKEQNALLAHSEIVIGIEEELAEARRRAGLTDFERNIEDIQKEQEERRLAFEARMQELQDELTAVQSQKAQILALEQSTLATINGLRLQAAQIYEGILSQMATATEEEVGKMIELLQSVQGLAAPEAEAFDTGVKSVLSGGASTINVEINIQEVPEGATAQDMARFIIDEITRQVELKTLQSS